MDPLGPGDPAQLGPYRLEGVLGHGGMGTVYLGREQGGARVAVKVVRPDLARQPEFLARFRREADVAQRVARFCTAEVVDVGSDLRLGLPYLVTEYVDGPTLFEAIRSDGPMTPADLDRLAVAVAAGLIAIHGAGMVHRDLKPSNVLLSPMGPRVIDFGIARALDATTMITQHLQSVGTPAFMSPEQARGEHVGAAADVFSWGGIVTFAGTGRAPFGVGSTPTLLFRTVYEPPDLDGLPGELRGVVEAAMAKDPADRPTARALFDTLMGLPTAPTPAQPSPTTRPAWTGGTTATTAGPITANPTAVTPPPATPPPTTPPPATPPPRTPLPTTPPPATSSRAAPPSDQLTRLAEPHLEPDSSSSGPAPVTANAGRSPRATGTRRLPLWAAGVLALAVLAAVVVTLLVTRAVIGDKQAEDASRRLAAQAVSVAESGDDATAQRLAVNAYRLAPTAEAAQAVAALLVADEPMKVSRFVELACKDYAFSDDEWRQYAPEVESPGPCE